MKIKDLLPIGSIVLLKDGEKRLMINGIMQSDASGNGQEYDYLGILYPEGHIGDQFQYLFNHEDVVKVHFRGFEDIERQEFIYNLSEFYKEVNKAKEE